MQLPIFFNVLFIFSNKVFPASSLSIYINSVLSLKKSAYSGRKEPAPGKAIAFLPSERKAIQSVTPSAIYTLSNFSDDYKIGILNIKRLIQLQLLNSL